MSRKASCHVRTASMVIAGAWACLALSAAWLHAPLRAAEPTPVTLALNWKAQAELGGFYHALVHGQYEGAGLTVTIKQGGPMINHRPQLAFGQIEFLIGTNLLQPFDAVKQQIPTRVVAAFLQTDPQCLIPHPQSDVQSWSELKQAPLFMGNLARQSFFAWLHAAHGFSRAKLRPYNHDLGPFLLDETAVVQGYVTSEPKRIEDLTGKLPRAFLLADHGWSSYSTVLETRNDLIENQPQLVQRFVDASVRGWVDYLHGEAARVAATNARIRRENPTLTAAQLDYARQMLIDRQLVEGGDAKRDGVGAMRLKRIEEFYRQAVDAGLYRTDEIDPRNAVTFDFVNRRVGVAP